MSEISPSSIGENDAEFARRISECLNVEQMKTVRDEFLLKKNLARPDEFNADVLIPIEQPATTGRVAHRITIDGESHIFEGANEAEASAAELAFLRTLPTTAAQPRDDAGRFFRTAQGAADEAAAAKEEAEAIRISNAAELELRFKRSEVSAAEYLEQSGAIEKHLEKQGISVDALKAQSAQMAASTAYVATWKEATSAFLRSPAGADWQFGEDNKNRLGHIIELLSEANPDIEQENKVEVLAHAWSIMKRNDAQTAALANAKTPQEIRDALGMDERARNAIGSGLFGR